MVERYLQVFALNVQPEQLNQSHDCNCTVTFIYFFISLACAFIGMLDAATSYTTRRSYFTDNCFI